MPQLAFHVSLRVHTDICERIFVDPAKLGTRKDGRRKSAAANARAQFFRRLREADWDISFRDIMVKSLGMEDTPREIADRKVAAFNRHFPIGSPIKVYPMAMGDHSTAYDTTVAAPGCFVSSGLYPVVKVPTHDGWIVLEHVIPLVPPKSEAA